MDTPLPVNTRRYGTPRSLPETLELRAGPVTLTLENADLRGVKFGGVEILQRLYVAIRDRNWTTIEPEYSRFTVHNRGESFEITFQAANKSSDVDFTWSGSITGSENGTIVYRMDGAPRKSFFRNRIGFCVLHPMTVAGLPATVTTPDGTVEGEFPINISPNQPFIDMTSISHPVGDAGSVTIRFEGDLFEVEDQRNWTDASYKTYSTPLRLPYPVEIFPGERITQIVTVSVAGTPPVVARIDSAPADLTIDFDNQTAMPEIGFGAGRKPIEDPRTIELLADLKAARLLGDLDLSAEPEQWKRRLGNMAKNAQSVGAPLDLSVVAGPERESWQDLATEIAENGYEVRQVFVFPHPDDPVTFPRTDLVTHESTVADAKAAFSDDGIIVSGGSRAYFTELNRCIDLIPQSDLGSIMFTVSPEIHAVDNRSIIENIAAQAVAVSSARALIGDKHLTVGPITLKPPYNPNATSEPPKAGPDRLPDAVDLRQLSLLGAGWTIGSLHHLAAAGADAVTYFELAGWRGLIEKTEELTRRELFPSMPGGLFPIFHVFNAISSFGPAQMAAVHATDLLGAEGLALIAGNRVRILVANLTNSDRAIIIDTGNLQNATIHYLDEANYMDSITRADLLTINGESISAEQGQLSLELPPFAIAVINAERS